MCTKIHQTPPAAFVGLNSGLCIAKPWMRCICYCANSTSPTIGVPFYCLWILKDLGWFLAKILRGLGRKNIKNYHFAQLYIKELVLDLFIFVFSI